MIPKKITRRFLLWAGVLGGMVVLGGAISPAAQTEKGATPMVYNVCDYGAVPGGERLNTPAIQAAIDACTAAGGGTVYVPPGRYLSGSIALKDNVTLHLEAGAVIVGSPFAKDYTERALIHAEGARNIAIQGRGTVDGQGGAPPDFRVPDPARAGALGPGRNRPQLIRLTECEGVRIRDVLLKNAAAWVTDLQLCRDVNVHGVTIRSRVNANNDGIDIVSCENVRVSDCDIWSGDDAIVLKCPHNKPCRNVAISNCVISSTCNAIKLGTETFGGFENIAVSNCTIYDTRLGGLTILSVDGATLDGVTISNITMRNVGAPLFIRLGNRGRYFEREGVKPYVGRLRNVLVSNVQCTGASDVGCGLCGLPGHPIENVTLENLRFSFVGGGTAADASRMPEELPEKYPEFNMFGKLPAYGFFVRHVKSLKMSNVQVRLEKADARPPFAFHDVQDLELFRVEGESTPEAEVVIGMTDVSDALVHGCRARPGAATFLRVQGAQSKGIRLLNNDLTDAKEALKAPAGVVLFVPAQGRE